MEVYEQDILQYSDTWRIHVALKKNVTGEVTDPQFPTREKLACYASALLLDVSSNSIEILIQKILWIVWYCCFILPVSEIHYKIFTILDCNVKCVLIIMINEINILILQCHWKINEVKNRLNNLEAVLNYAFHCKWGKSFFFHTLLLQSRLTIVNVTGTLQDPSTPFQKTQIPLRRYITSCLRHQVLRHP